jgi:hypothetical protein
MQKGAQNGCRINPEDFFQLHLSISVSGFPFLVEMPNWKRPRKQIQAPFPVSPSRSVPDRERETGNAKRFLQV